MEETVKDMLTKEQAAGELNISVATLYRWIKDGRVRTRRYGGRLLISRVEVARLLKGGE
ncbi:MAG: helix-turn-helix domain-containing protein [Candidatus Obscuribacter sp.]|nr:helix-turn-helix domain-containing protein [Candidatus Obscuribacter sp.]